MIVQRRVGTSTRAAVKRSEMSIKEQLEADGTAALKNKDRLKLGVIRMVRSQVKNAEIAKGHELSDGETIDVLVSAVKARRETRDYANEGHRDDMVKQVEQELVILETYLPQALSEKELRGIIDTAIQSTGATGMNDMGQVMGIVMPQVKGQADGKQVNGMVRALLQGLSG